MRHHTNKQSAKLHIGEVLRIFIFHFEENAINKAKAIMELTGENAINLSVGGLSLILYDQAFKYCEHISAQRSPSTPADTIPPA